MLLKLISLPSQPTIHFSLNLPAFPPYLDPPQAYTAQVNHLLVEDLEVPNTIHSLDKSVGLMSLLEEVVFEINHRTGDGGGVVQQHTDEEKSVRVTCRFVDGAVEDWVLGGLSTEGTALISALDSIIHNVQESTLEDEKEHELYLQSQTQKNRSRGMNRLSMPPPPTPLVFTPTSKPRHKKQRSLFMQIVSSIVNLTSTSSSSSHLPTFVDHSNPEIFYSPPPSPTTNSAPATPPSSKHARFLRRTARSSLVNTYRRHVLPELTRRFPKEGGFTVWILHSMRRRALERMEDLIEEAARIHQHQHHQHQQVLELQQRHENEEREQEQQFRYQQERARSPIRVDDRPFGPRFSMEEAGFSATTMTVPLSFSDEGGENENEPTNVRNNEEVEDDLETITDGSSVHTPSSTSHIGSGFMGGSSSDSAPDSPTPSSPPFTPTTATSRPPSLPPKSPNPSNPQPPLPPHFHFEYTQLSRLRQRLYSLILFADSQMRIAEDEKRNREEVILVRGRRRAWLNRELGVGVSASAGSATGAGNGMGHMQWGFAAPFKSSPLARYSWSASTELDVDASANDTNAYLLDAQQVDEEDEDDFPYDEFRGPPAVRSHQTLSYAYGRQSRRSSRYINGGGGGSGKRRLLPVAEEIEYEYDQNSTNKSDVDGIDIQLYKPPPGLGGPGDNGDDDSFHHRDDSFLHYHHHHHHQGEGDVDGLNDDFSLEDPRELDLELGFGLQDPNDASSIGEDGQELFSIGEDDGANPREHGHQRRSGESIRIAFEMERPKIIPRVRDGLDDECSILSVSATSSNNSTSTRSGGLLSWGYWGVGKSSGDGEGSSGGGGTIKRRRSWKNGIGIGIAGLGSRGRSPNKTCQRRGEGEGEGHDKQQQQQQLRYRASTSSTSSSTSSSSTKSQQQQRHQREPPQVELLEPELHRDDEYHLPTTPLLCQPVSFSVSHAPALAATATLPPTSTNALATTSTTSSVPMTVAMLPPNDTPKDTTENLNKEATPTTTTLATNNLTFVPSPLSFTTKKLCMTSPAPNVYADIDVSIVHVGDDNDKSLNNLGISAANHHAGASHHTATRVQQGGTSHHATPRLRPRRHKREYQYHHHQHHAYGNDVHFGQDECDEFELSGYGHFEGGRSSTTHSKTQHVHQLRHNPMIHARLHLDELLLEEGLFGCDPVGDQEEFTLAMDVPARGGGGNSGFGLGGAGGKKALRKMQYLQLHHNNRDSSNRSRLQQQSLPPLSSSFTNSSSSSNRVVIQEFGEYQNPQGSVVC